MDSIIYAVGITIMLLWPVLTIIVFSLDFKLRSGAGDLLMDYVTLVLFRNVCLVYFFKFTPSNSEGLETALTILSTYFEFSSAYCQTTIIHKIFKTISSNLPMVTDHYKCQQYIFGLVLLLGKSAIIIILICIADAFILFLIKIFWADMDVYVVLCIFVITLLFPLTLYNSLKCVLVGLKVRAVRQAVEGDRGQFKVNGGPQLKWYQLLLKIIFMSGILSDIMYCAMLATAYLDIPNKKFVGRIVASVWFLRGIEVLFMFVFKKEVWNRIKSNW